MKITERVHALKIPFQIPVTLEKSIDRFVYMFLITGEKIHLIDTGVKGAHEIIFDYVKKLGRDKNEISSIILTHSHPDHIGSAKTIKDITGCTVYASSIEADWIEDTEKQFRERPIPGFNNLVEGPVKIDKFLFEKDRLKLEDGITLKVIYTPGHSDGSVSFHFLEENILFTGDAVLLPGEIPIYTDVKKYFESLQKIKKIENVNILLSSWDEPKKDYAIKETVDKSRMYVEQIQKAVERTAESGNDFSTMDFCFAVLDELKLPKIIANPLLLKSFQANLNFKLN